MATVVKDHNYNDLYEDNMNSDLKADMQLIPQTPK